MEADFDNASGPPEGGPRPDNGLPPGIRSEAVTHWLEQAAGLRPPARYELISGGRSNLAYRVEDREGRALVLRRPPLGNVLDTAHDMGREWRIISALQSAPVPVAPALAFCDDSAVTGAPFYVMGFVAGHILDDANAAEMLPRAARAAAGRDFVDVLARLHAVDPDAVGLGSLGRRDGYIERQLRRWSRQWEMSKTRELPVVDEIHRRLSRSIPRQQRTGIVHGDFRLGNMIVEPDGRIAAVLDWELATLGDVLADLGWALSSWAEPGDPAPSPAPPTALPGFPARAQVVERYGAATGLDLTNLNYYLAFARWRSVCINEGVYARYRAGVMGADDLDLGEFDARIRHQADAALEALNSV